jgi:hypothetical protein
VKTTSGFMVVGVREESEQWEWFWEGVDRGQTLFNILRGVGLAYFGPWGWAGDGCVCYWIGFFGIILGPFGFS